MTLDLKAEPMQHIEFVSDEALDQMDRIADKAKSKLQGGSTVGSDSFASVNTLMGTDAIQNLEQISAANRESFQTLVKEPAIARVVAEDEDGHRQTYYICRAAALSGFFNHTG